MSSEKPVQRRDARKVARLLWLSAVASSAALGCGTFSAGGSATAQSPPPNSVSEAVTSRWGIWNPFREVPPPPPVESMVIRAGHLEAEAVPQEGTPRGDLAGAKDLYRQGEFAKAENVFRNIADNTKNSSAVAEEARYYEAECVRRQSRYPAAADIYSKLLKDFPNGSYREQACQHLFDIANYWLDDTRELMRKDRECREGKRWWVGTNFFQWDRTKPLLDEEGRAIEKLEQVRYNDITGTLAERSLFLTGSVKFFHGDYRESDFHFTQLVERFPNSPLAPQALELAIISKHMSTGGSDYDGRKVAEARQLVDTALRTYPEFAQEKSEFLNRQLIGINLQQAEKDFKRAEFYRRTKHLPSAYFYYEIVRRRYPGTRYHDQATERMNELRTQLTQKQIEMAEQMSGPQVAPAGPAPSGGTGAQPQNETLPVPRRVEPGQLPGSLSGQRP